MWGAVQPLYGAVADRYGTFPLICLGAVLVALGTGLTPFVHRSPALVLCLGVIAAAGAGAGSFSILIGWIAQHLPEKRRAFAAGFINAGSSLGQFLFAPLTQTLINHTGWTSALLIHSRRLRVAGHSAGGLTRSLYPRGCCTAATLRCPVSTAMPKFKLPAKPVKWAIPKPAVVAGICAGTAPWCPFIKVNSVLCNQKW